MRSIRTLVLVASEKKARFFVNEGIGKGLREVEDASASVLVPEAHEFADDPGRNSAAPGMARHALDPRTGEREHKRREFAELVAEELARLWESGSYNRIVIAAPPKMLAELRNRIGRLAEHVYAEVDKDLVNIEPRALPDRFADVVVF